jgi:ABC-2 type transport system permease protein
VALRPLGYRPWAGRRRGPAFRFWPIARTGMSLVLKRKIFWLFLLLSLFSFLLNSAVIYLQAQVQERLGQRIPRGLSQNFLFTGSGEAYQNFILFQGTVVMMMLALAGSLLVGSDFRSNALPFYLSKPIGRLDYLLGKFLAMAGLAALVTVLPAVVLFIEYGAFTESFAYYREHLHLLLAIVLYGALVCVVPSLLLLGVASLLKRTIPILLAWGGIFIFLPGAVDLLHRLQVDLGAPDPWRWKLLDLWWADLRWVSDAIFGLDRGGSAERWPAAAAVLGGSALLSALVFWKRISAAEVVR